MAITKLMPIIIKDAKIFSFNKDNPKKKIRNIIVVKNNTIKHIKGYLINLDIFLLELNSILPSNIKSSKNSKTNSTISLPFSNIISCFFIIK